eukprot:3885092-Prorocentrum_lima.AAC.1
MPCAGAAGLPKPCVLPSSASGMARAPRSRRGLPPLPRPKAGLRAGLLNGTPSLWLVFPTLRRS